MIAPQLGLLSEPELYLAQRAGPAYFATLVRDDRDEVGARRPRMRQECHNVVDMPFVLRSLDRRRDSYVSQATFRVPQRRIATLDHIGLVWADLDDPLLRELRNEYGEAHVVERILRAIDDVSIPAPSLIVSSGRGYHAKWLFERSVPWRALHRWDALVRTIVDRLYESLRADKNCVDAARVLRCVDTVNSKSGEIARVAWENRDQFGDVVRYPFDRLCDEVLPYLRRSHHLRAEEHHAERDRAQRKAPSVVATYTKASLWWGRYCDIRRLCELRGWIGETGVPEGYRDQILFLGATALTWYAPMRTWWLETGALAADLVPTLHGDEWRAYAGATWRRMQASAANGTEARYRYSTARIVRDLAIAPAEQEHLQQLVSPELAASRKRENDRKRDELRRRAAGAVERDVYVARAAERARKARELAETGLSARQVAERLGVSERTVFRLLANPPKEGMTSPSRCIGGVAPPFGVHPSPL